MPIYLGRLGHGSILREPVFFHAKIHTTQLRKRYLTLVCFLISYSSPKLAPYVGIEPTLRRINSALPYTLPARMVLFLVHLMGFEPTLCFRNPP